MGVWSTYVSMHCMQAATTETTRRQRALKVELQTLVCSLTSPRTHNLSFLPGVSPCVTLFILFHRYTWLWHFPKTVWPKMALAWRLDTVTVLAERRAGFSQRRHPKVAVRFIPTTVTNTKTKSTLWREGFLLSFRTWSIMGGKSGQELKYERGESYLLVSLHSHCLQPRDSQLKKKAEITEKLTQARIQLVLFIHSRIICPGNGATHTRSSFAN